MIAALLAALVLWVGAVRAAEPGVPTTPSDPKIDPLPDDALGTVFLAVSDLVRAVSEDPGAATDGPDPGEFRQPEVVQGEFETDAVFKARRDAAFVAAKKQYEEQVRRSQETMRAESGRLRDTLAKVAARHNHVIGAVRGEVSRTATAIALTPAFVRKTRLDVSRLDTFDMRTLSFRLTTSADRPTIFTPNTGDNWGPATGVVFEGTNWIERIRPGAESWYAVDERGQWNLVSGVKAPAPGQNERLKALLTGEVTNTVPLYRGQRVVMGIDNRRPERVQFAVRSPEAGRALKESITRGNLWLRRHVNLTAAVADQRVDVTAVAKFAVVPQGSWTYYWWRVTDHEGDDRAPRLLVLRWEESDFSVIDNENRLQDVAVSPVRSP